MEYETKPHGEPEPIMSLAAGLKKLAADAPKWLQKEIRAWQTDLILWAFTTREVLWYFRERNRKNKQRPP
jgi:hypothetical protein